MKIRHNDFIFLTGKANTGKTTFARVHMERIPANDLYIFDFNQTDYQDFQNSHVWNYEGGGVREAEDFLNTTYAIGNCFVVLDETDNYLRNQTPTNTRYVTTARNRGIGTLAIGKRPMAIHPMFRTRFNKLVVFRLTETEDIEYIREWVGAARGSLDFIKELPDHHFVVFDLDNGTMSEVSTLNV